MSEHEWDFEITNNGNQSIRITTCLGHKQGIPGRSKYSGRYDGTGFVLDPIDGPPFTPSHTDLQYAKSGKYYIYGGELRKIHNIEDFGVEDTTEEQIMQMYDYLQSKLAGVGKKPIGITKIEKADCTECRIRKEKYLSGGLDAIKAPPSPQTD